MRILFYIIIAILGGIIIYGYSRKDKKEKKISMADELDFQKRKDVEVIKALKSNGSDLTKHHLIEHHFITHSKEDGMALLNWGEQNGFQVSELSEGDFKNERYFYFDLIKPTVPSIENLFEDTSTMVRMAPQYNCEYDGWGCEVQR